METIKAEDLKLKEAELEEKLVKIKIDQANLLLEKIDMLRQLLEASVPQASDYGDSKYIAVFEENEVELIKTKLFTLIKEL